MNGESRFIEIDLVRGIAILMMILFHTLFDISYFGIAPVNVASGFWRYFAYATATLFLLIVGISLVVSHDRAAARLDRSSLVKKFLVRGAGIFALGLLVTIATWIYIPEGFIVFGILHLIGISVMLSPFFFRFGRHNIVLGIACILFGLFVIGQFGSVLIPPSAQVGVVLPVILLPLGIHAPAFWSVDYTPLFPWFGVVLLGMGLGTLLYGGGVRHFPVPRLPPVPVLPIAFIGRHSLLIYLLHQPLIILLLAAVTGVRVW